MNTVAPPDITQPLDRIGVDEIGPGSPVFVDTTGRRLRVVRLAAALVCTGCLLYIGVLAASLLTGGNVGLSTLFPDNVAGTTKSNAATAKPAESASGGLKRSTATSSSATTSQAPAVAPSVAATVKASPSATVKATTKPTTAPTAAPTTAPATTAPTTAAPTTAPTTAAPTTEPTAPAATAPSATAPTGATTAATLS